MLYLPMGRIHTHSSCSNLLSEASRFSGRLINQKIVITLKKEGGGVRNINELIYSIHWKIQ